MCEFLISENDFLIAEIDFLISENHFLISENRYDFYIRNSCIFWYQKFDFLISEIIFDIRNYFLILEIPIYWYQKIITDIRKWNFRKSFSDIRKSALYHISRRYYIHTRRIKVIKHWKWKNNIDIDQMGKWYKIHVSPHIPKLIWIEHFCRRLALIPSES